MSWALFIDESGQDQQRSPYEVLAGVAVEDRKLWKLICDLSRAQVEIFGLNLFEIYGKEAKAQKLLKTNKHKKRQCRRQQSLHLETTLSGRLCLSQIADRFRLNRLRLHAGQGRVRGCMTGRGRRPSVVG